MELNVLKLQMAFLEDQPINDSFTLRALRAGMFKEDFPNFETGQFIV